MAKEVTVLVVDDEPEVCWALDTLLRRHGFTVVTMDSGARALGWLNRPDQDCRLILLDAKLGDIDGVELARRIRADTRCTAPVILVSGYFYRDDSVVQDSLSAGLIAAFVTKPFQHDEILSAISIVLQKQKL